MRRAKGAGVPVFCIDREINANDAATSQILSDSYSGCVASGQYFVETVGEESELESSGPPTADIPEPSPVVRNFTAQRAAQFNWRMTEGGIIGEVVFLKDNRITLKTAESTRIVVAPGRYKPGVHVTNLRGTAAAEGTPWRAPRRSRGAPPRSELPRDVVTMNSQVVLRDGKAVGTIWALIQLLIYNVLARQARRRGVRLGLVSASLPEGSSRRGSLPSD